ENGYCESFNGKLRDECLRQEIFYSLKEAQIVIGLWGTVRNSVCGRRVEHQAAMARVKRSPKMTANCALAMTHSRGPTFHAFSERFKTR
ncbi:hypothetical protein ABID82_007257, partial [Methylobacterium sp. PvP062]